MASLWINEYGSAVSVIGTTIAQVLPQPPLVSQAAIAIGAASVPSAAFSAKTYAVELFTDTACGIAFSHAGGAIPVASAVLNRMAANERRVYAVEPGAQVAVIN